MKRSFVMTTEKLLNSGTAWIRQEDGRTEEGFLCGSVIFPVYRQAEKPGIVCVCAFFPDGEVYCVSVCQFTLYNFALAEYFQKIYNQYKLNAYFVMDYPEEDLQKTKFLIEMEKRKLYRADKLYPVLRTMQIQTDTQLFAPLLALGRENKLFYKSALIRNAIGNYDPKRNFQEAPHPIQALSLCCCAGMDGAWKAFLQQEYDGKNKEDQFWKGIFNE